MSWQIIFEIINHGEQDIITFLENNMESHHIIDGLIANSEKENKEDMSSKETSSSKDHKELPGNGKAVSEELCLITQDTESLKPKRTRERQIGDNVFVPINK